MTQILYEILFVRLNIVTGGTGECISADSTAELWRQNPIIYHLYLSSENYHLYKKVVIVLSSKRYIKRCKKYLTQMNI